MKRVLFTFVFLSALITGCKSPIEEEKTANGKDNWLKGNDFEKFDVVAKQLRGFDMTMVETGYRYQELYWAGKDQNWEYANYQIQKIKKTIANGLQRRPKRGESAQHFLNVSLPEIERVINTKDTLNFNNSFRTLTNACNNCHTKENVSFFAVKTPIYRPSPIRK